MENREKIEQEQLTEPEIGLAIVNLTTANKEYEFILPKNLRGFRMQCRDGTTFRYSFLRGKVGTAAPSEPYATVLANGHLQPNNLNLEEKTIIYMAEGTGGKVVEFIMWYKEEIENGS